jgi:hypothetical protein
MENVIVITYNKSATQTVFKLRNIGGAQPMAI